MHLGCLQVKGIFCFCRVVKYKAHTYPWDEQYIYLHLPHTKSTIHAGKYTVRPMDGMGFRHSKTMPPISKTQLRPPTFNRNS